MLSQGVYEVDIGDIILFKMIAQTNHTHHIFFAIVSLLIGTLYLNGIHGQHIDYNRKLYSRNSNGGGYRPSNNKPNRPSNNKPHRKVRDIVLFISFHIFIIMYSHFDDHSSIAAESKTKSAEGKTARFEIITIFLFHDFYPITIETILHPDKAIPTEGKTARFEIITIFPYFMILI